MVLRKFTFELTKIETIPPTNSKSKEEFRDFYHIVLVVRTTKTPDLMVKHGFGHLTVEFEGLEEFNQERSKVSGGATGPMSEPPHYTFAPL